MSRSVAAKAAAFLAAVLLLTVLLSCGAAFVYLSTNGLYQSAPENLQENRSQQEVANAANTAARRYGLTHLAQGPEEVLGSSDFLSLYYGILENIGSCGSAYYTEIRSTDGTVLESNLSQAPTGVSSLVRATRTVSAVYPVVVEGSAEDTDADAPADCLDIFTFYLGQTGRPYTVYLAVGPEYDVTVALIPSEQNTNITQTQQLLYPRRYGVIVLAAVSALALIADCVYLCWVSGRLPDGTIRPGGVNRLPLDVHLLADLVAWMLMWGVLETVYRDWVYQPELLLAALAVLLVSAALAVAFLCGLSAQLKAGKGRWWRGSLAGRVLLLVGKGTRAFFRKLPVIWRYVLLTLGLLLLEVMGALASDNWRRWPLFLTTGICLSVLAYLGYELGTLYTGGQAMARGNLQQKVPTGHLVGACRDFANSLNAVADVAVVAARNQMKSERMKTELITNVSHDIKTPLTSIINFVDLLQKPHTPEEEAQYLDVLSRQSLRLKRLIEDLMELSKASSGNISANIVTMDATEMVSQALGEFTDKLTAATLTPVFRPPETPTPILADGRLAWRVLSNLLSNAVKYSMPGTRLYVDVVPLPGKVLVSMKNISRQPLNLRPEELLERFVRGDISRNTEGSGLGLNIARSLMEVQHGQLQLLVDGDLFKVTLLFPAP